MSKKDNDAYFCVQDAVSKKGEPGGSYIILTIRQPMQLPGKCSPRVKRGCYRGRIRCVKISLLGIVCCVFLVT